MNVYLAIVFIALGILLEKGGRRLRDQWRKGKETIRYAVYDDTYYPEVPFPSYQDNDLGVWDRSSEYVHGRRNTHVETKNEEK